MTRRLTRALAHLLRMRSILLVLAVAACHSQPRPVLSAEQRVQASLARWGGALQRGDARALANAEDRGGQLAIPYAAIKAAASQAPDGAQAVEHTVFTLVAVVVLQSLWPGIFGEPKQTWFAYVPAGPLGPSLVEAGLATPVDSSRPEAAFVIVPVPWQSTIGRIEEASKQHRTKLVEQRAWTCQLAAIEKTILPTEPTLVRAAAISQNIFGGWLRDVEQLWLVRADCASGPALFVVTAQRDGADRILLAKLF
jgi:hypothetical protein